MKCGRKPFTQPSPQQKHVMFRSGSHMFYLPIVQYLIEKANIEAKIPLHWFQQIVKLVLLNT